MTPASAPRGAKTLVEALDEARAEGHDTQMTARDDGDIDCGGCHRAVNPASMRVTDRWRLEGASDAADMLMVIAVLCGACGTRGVLIVGYGPNAGEADTRALEHLEV